MTCDLCGSGVARPLFEARDRRFGTPGRYCVVACTSCGLARTEPWPADLSAVYPAAYYTHAVPAKPSRRDRLRLLRAYGQRHDLGLITRLTTALLADRLLPGLPPGPPGRVLDVGCGSGRTLLLLKEAGWEAVGAEIDEQAVAAARRAGLEVRQGDFAHMDFEPASFDAVRFWHSLEHVASPRAQLLAARRAVRRGGSLSIGVPNRRSFLTRVFRDRSYYVEVPRHLWHFDARTLARLLAESGFRVVRTRQLSSSEPLFGTLAYAVGRPPGNHSRAAWCAALPLAILLDSIRLGDALELHAVAV